MTLKDGEELSIYDAAMDYIAEGVPLVVLAGKEYGSGSSRDWAAKGTTLLGVRAVIAESFERIHRSNLVGMGVLPLQFADGDNVESLGLTGEETFSIAGIAEPLNAGEAVPRELTGHGRRQDVRGPRAHRHAQGGATTSATAGSCRTCCACSRRRAAPDSAHTNRTCVSNVLPPLGSGRL